MIKGRAKTISAKHLRAAVKAAAAAAHEKFPKVRAPADEELYWWPYIICGIPIPWPILEGIIDAEHAGYAATFTQTLSRDSRMAAVAGELEKVEPAAFAVGGHAVIGVRVGGVTLSE